MLTLALGLLLAGTTAKLPHPREVRIAVRWSNHLSASLGWTLVSPASKGAAVFTVTFSLSTHAPGKASLGALDENAVAALLQQLDALDWERLRDGETCGSDSTRYEVDVTLGQQTHHFSLDGACHDPQNKLLQVVEAAVKKAAWDSPAPTPQRELPQDAGRPGPRGWPRAVTLSNGELCRWEAPSWSCSGGSGLGGLARVNDAWFGLGGSAEVTPGLPVELHTVWW